MHQAELRQILTDRNLAQLGDSILNFALSAAITRTTGKPSGRRVKNSLLTPLIDDSPFKQALPLRSSRRDRADAFEALVGYLWLHGELQTDSLVGLMVKSWDDWTTERELERHMLQAVLKMLVERIEDSQAKPAPQT